MKWYTLKNKKEGFTLIELLVVIAIIGLLASMILASVNTARNRARKARILQELAEIQKAAEFYATDSGSFYPADGAASFGSFTVPSVFGCKQSGSYAPTRYRWTNYGTGEGGSGGVAGTCRGIGLLEADNGWGVWGWIYDVTPNADGCYTAGTSWRAKEQLADYIVGQCY